MVFSWISFPRIFNVYTCDKFRYKQVFSFTFSFTRLFRRSFFTIRSTFTRILVFSSVLGLIHCFLLLPRGNFRGHDVLFSGTYYFRNPSLIKKRICQFCLALFYASFALSGELNNVNFLLLLLDFFLILNMLKITRGSTKVLKYVSKYKMMYEIKAKQRPI